MLGELRAHGLPPDVYTSSNAIAACEAGGDWKGALRTLRELERPNEACYNAAMGACARAGEWRRAVELLAEMKRGGKGSEGDEDGEEAAGRLERRRGGAKRGEGCGTEIQGEGSEMEDRAERENRREPKGPSGRQRRGKKGEGERRLENGSGGLVVRPSARSYTAALTACGRGGAWEEALELLDEMGGGSVSPDGVCYSAAINACAVSGAWQQVVTPTKRASLHHRATGSAEDHFTM